MAICNPIVAILACVSAALLSACASSVVSGNPKEAGLTVSQLYQGAINESQSSAVPRYRIKTTTVGYQDNDTMSGVKPLDNPTVPIFIYPHVALIGDEQLIKPGY